MKTFVIAAALLVGTVSSALATGPYVGGATGLSLFHDSDLDRGGSDESISYKAGVAVNAIGGYDFDGFRLEGEYSYKHADIREFAGQPASGLDTAIHSVMANMLYEFTPNRAVTPVVGLGLGVLFGDFSDSNSTYHDTQAGYQASVGAAIKLGERANLDLTYRLQGSFGDFHIGISDLSYLSSNLLVGARYRF